MSQGYKIRNTILNLQGVNHAYYAVAHIMWFKSIGAVNLEFFGRWLPLIPKYLYYQKCTTYKNKL